MILALLEVASVVGEGWDLAVVESVLGWPEDRLLLALEGALALAVLLLFAHARPDVGDHQIGPC